MGKRWDAMWKSFDEMMAKLPGAIDEAIEGGVDGATVTQVSNGHVKLRGKFKSIEINGTTVRVADWVMMGKEKPRVPA